MVSEVGIVGLTAFFGIMARLFKTSIPKIRDISSEESLKVLFLGLVAGVVAFLVHSFFDTNFYSLQLSVEFWLMTALMAVVYKLLNDKSIHVIK